MLDFMIIALPRSGTTWAANWLTGERTFCMHDPLWTTHYSEIDAAVSKRAGGRLAGISCTAIWRWPDWLKRHPAKKLILHRDASEVRQSLVAAGIPVFLDHAQKLAHIEGEHAPWTDLFDPARASALWAWLTGGLPFDAERHAELVKLEIQPRLGAVERDADLNRRLAEELGIGPIEADSPLTFQFGGGR